MDIYKKITCFMGSFNPIHLGHLNIIDGLMGLYDEIHIIPSPHNPHKNEKDLLPYDLRCSLVNSALQDCVNGTYLKMNYHVSWKVASTKVILNKIEENMSKPNYTYLTLRKLKEELNCIPSIILGTDVINNLPKWKNFEEIKTYPIIHAIRPDVVLDTSIDINITKNVVANCPQSSTMIRDSISKNEPYLIKNDVTPSVFKSLLRYYNIENLNI